MKESLVGNNVLGMLGIRDIVMLERACGSKASHQHFFDLIPYCAPVLIPSKKHDNISSLEWFAKRRCKIKSLRVCFPFNSSAIHVKNLEVDELELHLKCNTTTEDCKILFENNLGHLVRSIIINGDLKLNEILISTSTVTISLITLILQSCTELTSIELYGCTVDYAIVMAIAQHCPKLEKLELFDYLTITYKSLIALPLKELHIPNISNILTADIARRCSHALFCIRHLSTNNLYENGQDATILIPYMTGLTSVNIEHHSHIYIHLLTKIVVYNAFCTVSVILSLCCANPLLQELIFYRRCGISDTALIELIHACPHIHTLYLPYETDFSDIGILALSEHCAQLQWLDVRNCKQVTEVAVLQLLQRCRKLTRLDVSSSSLSEDTWTQLDKNTQKRVSRC